VALVVAHLDVAIDGLGHADDLDAVADHLLGQEGGIGVGIIAADNHQGVQAEVLARLPRKLDLLLGVDFGAAGLDHGETAEVAIGVHQLPRDLDGLVFNDAVRPHQEAEHAVFRVGALGGVNSPAMTLCPPGAGPPEKTMPILRCWV